MKQPFRKARRSKRRYYGVFAACCSSAAAASSPFDKQPKSEEATRLDDFF